MFPAVKKKGGVLLKRFLGRLSKRLFDFTLGVIPWLVHGIQVFRSFTLGVIPSKEGIQFNV